MNYEDSTLKIFSENAEDYDSRMTDKFQDAERKLFMENVREGGKVLDLGSGPGRDGLVF